MKNLLKKIQEREEDFNREFKSKVVNHTFDGSCNYNDNGKGHKECRYPYNPGRENPSGEQCLKLEDEHFNIQSHIHQTIVEVLEEVEKEVDKLGQSYQTNYTSWKIYPNKYYTQALKDVLNLLSLEQDGVIDK